MAIEGNKNDVNNRHNHSLFGTDNSIKSNAIEIPSISLPKGGGAIQGIDEKFKVNPITGTSSFSIPIPFSPSRNGGKPSLALSYDSGSGNSPYGLGWELNLPKISRKTQKELPQYKDEIESDTFLLSGQEDLIPTLKKENGNWKRIVTNKTEDGIDYTVFQYRPRIENSFSRIERWVRNSDKDTHWRTISANNIHSYYGLTEESRLCDPKNPSHIFEWLLCRTHDDKGSLTHYYFKKEDFTNVPNSLNEKNRLNHCTQTYLKTICYGVKTPYYIGDPLPEKTDFLFKLLLDYGEHDSTQPIPKDVDLEKTSWEMRQDAFSSYRSGFEIRTYRRCKRLMMFHCFESDDLPHTPYLTKSLELDFNGDLNTDTTQSDINSFSFLTNARQNGHIWKDSENHYSTKHLPDLRFEYQKHEWNTEIQQVSDEARVGAPIGIKDLQYLWIDLYSEGISGILTEQSKAWFYKSNLGNGQFSHPMEVLAKPNFSGISNGNLSIAELEANGIKSLVSYTQEPKGFFRLNHEDSWEPFRAFQALPNIGVTKKNTRYIDLNGNGKSDLLTSESDAFFWYPSEGEKGFRVSQKIEKGVDEEKGPAILFQNEVQSIFLADMSGDGLTDIVRIKNGEICYWPNLGYGHFGAKVSLENAPNFDHPDLFNPKLIRLADIDGSGTTDIIYITKQTFSIWFNHNGNSLSEQPKTITPFQELTSLTDVSVIDFLGTGTACIVYSSSNPKDADAPMQYINLMNSKKPHVLSCYKNGLGKEVSLEYKASTHFYLEDKKQGRLWKTKLPMPIQCVWKSKIEDKIRETVFTSSYHYSHGYFDPHEREYRGFARVEQLDTENFNQFRVNASQNVVAEELHQPPIKTIRWYHVGAYLNNEFLLHQLQDEYFKNTAFQEYNIPKVTIEGNLTSNELREAMRSYKGLPVQMEVYSEDGSPQQEYPFTVESATFTVKPIQPKATNKHACFQVLSSESITYTYDRNPEDPRIKHSMVLESDDLGKTIKDATLFYPRVKRPVAVNTVPDHVWEEQNKLHIIYNETEYSNDIDQEASYRLRLPFQSRTYEVNGIAQTADFFLSKSDLINKINLAQTLTFEVPFTNTPQKRLSAHGRTYFLNENLSTPLPLGQISRLGIPHKSYQLAFTKESVGDLYGTKVNDTLLTEAKYVHTEGDENWWAPSEEAVYASNPQDHFYRPIGAEDVYGNQSLVEYDTYHLLTKKTINSLGHEVSVVNDYRTLNAVQITDENLNRSAIEMDELGHVLKFAVMGKEGQNEGDTLEDPTSFMEYNVLNWQEHGKPNFVRTLAREQHGPSNTQWQERYTYSDGMGEAVMVKAKVEPGKAKQWNPVTKEIEEVDTDPRWVGNGRVIVNNKGNLIKQYEPYFSTTHAFETQDELLTIGVSPINYYDPLGRAIRTEYPDGTFDKVEFDSWKFTSFDRNDTVRDSQWFIDRGSPNPDVVSKPNDPEEKAAWYTAKHHNTPSVFLMDALGRPITTIAHHKTDQTASVLFLSDLFGQNTQTFDQLNRLVSQGSSNILGNPTYSKTAEKGEKWIFQDAMGRIVKTWNATSEFRFEFDDLHRPVASFVKQGSSELLYKYIVYGDQLPIAEAQNRNLAGRAYLVYDQAGVAKVTTVDFKNNILQTQRRLCTDYENAINWSALQGQASVSDIETTASTQLENEVFTATSEIDALNRPSRVTLPDKTLLEPTYNEANMLESLKAKIRGQGNFKTFLVNQDYNAKGQRQFVEFGNGLISNYSYDENTLRLINCITKRKGDPNTNSLQNLNYTYDPVGNVVYQKDTAQQTHYFKNAVVEAENEYEYDPMYQLIKATGREHAGLGSNGQRNHLDLPFLDQLPHVNNATAVREYTQSYEYDACGNILQMKHGAVGSNWTRKYKYAYQVDPSDRTNRLTHTNLPTDPDLGPFSASYEHDSKGNMIKMPHLDELEWNFEDQLKRVDLGGGGEAFYVTDAGGNRVRKIVQRNGGKRLERIYLGGVEIYREYQGANKTFERNTVHISDNTGKIAQIDTKTFDPGNTDPNNLLNIDLIRYQYGNFLGSSSMETDNNGTVISYEEYHPFGTSAYRSSKSDVDLSLKRYRFSGKERDDETGFYYFGTRYYAPWLGRWTSSDPAGYVDTTNLYQYCSNNPVSYKDSNGMDGDMVVAPHGNTMAEARAYWDGRIIQRENGEFVRVEVTSISESDTPGRRFNIQANFTPVEPIDVVANDDGSTAAPAESDSPTGNSQTQGTTSTSTPTSTPGNQSSTPQTPSSSSSPSGGNGAGGNGESERSFWSRGGGALAGGLLLLGAGLITIFTAGAATPALVLLGGAMATAGGIGVTTTSAIQLGASYSGHTTAEQDRRTTEGLNTVSSLSSPFGLVGGATGAMIADDPQEGLQTGALVGNVADLGYGLTRFGMSRMASGSYSQLSPDPKLAYQASVMPPTVPRGTYVLSTHGTPGMVDMAGTMVPVSELAPMIQASPNGRITVLACNVANDARAVQSLANQTGRSITAYGQYVGAHTYNNIVYFPVTASGVSNIAAGAAKPILFTPTYGRFTPYIGTSGATIVGGVQTNF